MFFYFVLIQLLGTDVQDQIFKLCHLITKLLFCFLLLSVCDSPIWRCLHCIEQEQIRCDLKATDISCMFNGTGTDIV